MFASDSFFSSHRIQESSSHSLLHTMLSQLSCSGFLNPYTLVILHLFLLIPNIDHSPTQVSLLHIFRAFSARSSPSHIPFPFHQIVCHILSLNFQSFSNVNSDIQNSVKTSNVSTLNNILQVSSKYLGHI